MPLSAALASAFQHIATVVSGLHEGYFDMTLKTYTEDIHFDGRKFEFLKFGYSTSGSFAGIGYQIKMFQPGAFAADQQWEIWIQNPSDSLEVNRKAVVAAIQTIIVDPNTGKISWTLNASDYADTA